MNFFKENPRRGKAKKVIVIGTLTILFGYFAFMIAYYATSAPKFCASCHQIGPYYATWQKSPHREVNCLYCHEFRGFLGKLHSKSRGLNYVYLHVTGQYTIYFKGQVFEENCVACHLGDYDNYSDAGRLDLDHYEYVKADKSCIECHREAGHGVNLFSKEKFKKE